MSMSAFAVDEFGAIGSIHQIPIPEPDEGEVLVSVRAAGVNVMDPLYVGGMLKDYMEHRFPLVPGIDLAGVAAAIGKGVDRFAVGDAVYGFSAKKFVGAGTFGGNVVVSSSDLAPKPTTLGFSEAAAVPHAGLTALAAVEAADPQPGQVVVVVGSTGGVGSFVTELAAARGATVVAVSASAGVTLARDLGAAEVIDYEAVDVAETIRARYPHGADALITMYGDLETVTPIARTVRSGGLVVSPAIRPDAAAAFADFGVGFKGASRLPGARLPELTALIEGGQLRVPPLTRFSLERTNDALREMATGHVRGKLVIEIG